MNAPNRLARELSPYLLQHAHNPVDWHPWGQEAFETARRQNKPVFLSIGYSTCHWCHVMAHESFEDLQVARLLNEAFVCVKVDREERPDVDGVYMAVCQLTTGSGGWPLTVALTPDKQPFFAGTYFPKHSQPNRIGMLDLIPRLKATWDERAGEVAEAVEQISHALAQTAHMESGQRPDLAVLDRAYAQLEARFDAAHGGFGTRPKFPTPHQLTFLLRHWRRTGQDRALHMVETTLDRMRLGGLFDHVGHGFHRYSTDAQWCVPHFEKMLYDQALLAIAYTEAFQATGRARHRQTAQQVLDYVLRELTDPQGGFYTAQDADSEGEEGKFYLWTTDELRAALPGELAKLAIEAFCVEAGGNFFEEASGYKTGANILHLKDPLDALARRLGLALEDLERQLECARQRLYAARQQRPQPLRDDKVLTDWNGLTIAALAKAARAFEVPRYAQAATKAADFIATRLTDARGGLLHRYRNGHAQIPGYLSDHAFLAWGLLELYEATFDPAHLDRALRLSETVLDRFGAGSGGFYDTAADADRLPVRRQDAYDGAIPSGNGVFLLVLVRLARMTGCPDLEGHAWALAEAAGGQVRQAPSGFTQLLQGVDFALSPGREVVVAAPSAADAAALVRELHRAYLPHAVVLLRTPQTQDRLDALAPDASHCVPRDGRACAYVCTRFACQAPLDSSAALKAALNTSGV